MRNKRVVEDIWENVEVRLRMAILRSTTKDCSPDIWEQGRKVFYLDLT